MKKCRSELIAQRKQEKSTNMADEYAANPKTKSTASPAAATKNPLSSSSRQTSYTSTNNPSLSNLQPRQTTTNNPSASSNPTPTPATTNSFLGPQFPPFTGNRINDMTILRVIQAVINNMDINAGPPETAPRACEYHHRELYARLRGEVLDGLELQRVYVNPREINLILRFAYKGLAERMEGVGRTYVQAHCGAWR
jgi:hypothetical protein